MREMGVTVLLKPNEIIFSRKGVKKAGRVISSDME
jgi:hypothetical protein